MKKSFFRIVIPLVIACILPIFCLFVGGCSPEAQTQLPVLGIVCWGDSLTAGAGGGGTNYPAVLKDRIEEEYGAKVAVENLGVGGESAADICARAGVYEPLAVTENFEIPAGKEKTPISLNAAVLRQGDGGVNPCVIAGVKGRISIVQTSYTSANYAYTFERSEAGEKVSVAAGTAVVTHASTAYKNYLSVVFIGQNGGYADFDELVGRQRALLRRQQENGEKYVILGLTSGTRAERAALEERMEAEFADKYINLREYLSGDGVKDIGVTPTKEDEAQMREGKVPPSLRADEVHLNKKGYRLVGNIVFERMKSLGYFGE